MVTERPTISESWSGKKLGFFQKVGSVRAVRAAGGAPVVVVRLPPSKMRTESKGVRAGSEATHSETRVARQFNSGADLNKQVASTPRRSGADAFAAKVGLIANEFGLDQKMPMHQVLSAAEAELGFQPFQACDEESMFQRVEQVLKAAGR
jgi:hypothetical protein